MSVYSQIHKERMNGLHVRWGSEWVGDARVMQKLKCSDCITIQIEHAE